MMKKANLKSRKSAPELAPPMALKSAQKSKSSFNLPKIKSKDAIVSNIQNAQNIPSQVTRILSNIAQILDQEVGGSSQDANQDTELDAVVSSTSNLSLTSEMMEMMLDEGIDAQGEFLPRFQNITYSTEIRRKVIKFCLDLKRIFDKESFPLSAGFEFFLQGISSICIESTIQKGLFAKTDSNITVLFRCLKEFLEVDCAVVITNLLIRLINGAESSTSNISFMAKKQLCPILIQSLQAIYSEHFSNPTNMTPNLAMRVDEVCLNLFTLMSKLAKHEPKLALIARLNGSVNISIKILRRAVEKKDYPLMMSIFTVLKVFVSKNENNLVTVQKSNMVPLIETICRAHSAQLSSGKLETIFDFISQISKSKAVAQDVLKYFGMKYFLANCTSPHEGLQKASLKVIKSLNEYDFGKQAFETCEGSKILTDLLNILLQNSDTNTLSSLNSVGSILVTALRSAVGQSDLPFLSQYKYRSFPLPSKKSDEETKSMNPDEFSSVQEDLPASNTKKDELNYEDLVDECARMLLAGKYPAIPSQPEKVEDLVKLKLRRLCPELSFLDGSAMPKAEAPSSNISVRHVQPMAPGKHAVCKNNVAVDPEPLLKKSPAVFRKVLFDQTARMFQNGQKGTLVYDVMNYQVAEDINPEDTLLFDSRFESGNLQLAIKISEFEYDLLLETDINSGPGKHNQWFNFSIRNMVPNTPYRFNILNMSKPASQFNNGMQPVMYSLLEPGWKRVGDNVFYIKNHFSKPAQSTSPEGEVQTTPSTNLTFSTLVFSVTFKNENDHCFLAYHYPYTYSELQRNLYQLHNTQKCRSYCRRTLLCRTLGGNDCILLTITDFENEKAIPMADRKYVFLSARVHPGESNSSHMMHGIIQFLLGSDEVASNLRKNFIFKIIPMLNPDGVINGSHRCSLAGVDMNRQWKNPCRILSPTIFWTKLLYRFLTKVNRVPLLSCDFHGHSRRKNVFIFGCENNAPEIDGVEKIFPQTLSQISPVFDFNGCKFNIEASKETTARVVLRRELNIINSFTLESTYCGMDCGEKKGYQIQTADLERMGADFLKGLNSLLTHSDLSKMCLQIPLDAPLPASASRESSAADTPKRTRKTKSTTSKKSPSVARKTLKKKSDSASIKPVSVKEAVSESSDSDG